jgi:hypothetical protein
VIVYAIASVLQKIIPQTSCGILSLLIIRVVAIFLAVYYFVYSIILTKKIVDKYYK